MRGGFCAFPGRLLVLELFQSDTVLKGDVDLFVVGCLKDVRTRLNDDSFDIVVDRLMTIKNPRRRSNKAYFHHFTLLTPDLEVQIGDMPDSTVYIL
jgi:hypothetical protein